MHTGKQAIFILGIMARSGTNFRTNLLIQHSDCGPPVPLAEDFLLANSDILGKFSDGVFQDWNGRWGVTVAEKKALDAALGAGLISFLGERSPSKRVVTKTPRLDGLEHFFRFFPEAKLLILVRDGRAIIESGMRSFNWRREGAIHAIAKAAAKINRFKSSQMIPPQRCRIVRYEDLCLRPERELRGLFEFLELDPEVYDFSAIDELPVVGSSDTAKDGGSVHWKPMRRSDDFDPLSRFEHWRNWRHYRYNRIAGPDMALLGYEMETTGGARWAHALLSAVLDLAWAVLSSLWPLYERVSGQRKRP